MTPLTSQTHDPLSATIASINGDIILTEEQQIAINAIISWFDTVTSPREFKLGGYAGTGKTTIIKCLIGPDLASKIHPVICAFTGKACHVLRKKGLTSAQTIHSLIYDAVMDEDGSVTFTLKSRLEARPNLIIIDEASMISVDLYRDLKSFGIKLLFIGDPGQLEPIGDNPNLMKQPDYVLTRIHRQAEKSPIITFASNVRNGCAPRMVDPTGVVNVKSKFITDTELVQCDQVLCAKNATRSLLNRRARQELKRVDSPLNVGEKIICLRNNRRFAMFNGLICYVKAIHREYADYWMVELQDEVEKTYQNIPLWKKPFISELTKDDIAFIPNNLIYADYGYAITVHKSQGSEWPHVLVYDEVMYKTNMTRWRYTAITRASEKLTYCI